MKKEAIRFSLILIIIIGLFGFFSLPAMFNKQIYFSPGEGVLLKEIKLGKVGDAFSFGEIDNFCEPSIEFCDGVDNDCDGVVDEGGICGDSEVGKNNPLFLREKEDISSFPYLLSNEEDVSFYQTTPKDLPRIKSEEFLIQLQDDPVVKFKTNQESGVFSKIQSVSSYKTSLVEKQNGLEIEIKNIAPSAKIEKKYQNVFNGFFIKDISNTELKSLENLPGVKKIYPNNKVYATLMDSVPLIGADQVWNMQSNGTNLTGEGVTIGIIDTGVDYTHPDLGRCFGIGCKVVDGWDFVNNDADPMDDHGHGTHVAATAAGRGVLNGVAPDAIIYAYKVLDAGGGGSWESVIGGIERATDPNQDNDFSDHLDIISLSLGGNGNPDDLVSQAIDNAVDLGIVATIAAGNSGPDKETIGSPGTARKAITVAASHKSDYIVYFSSRGPVVWDDGIIIKPDVTAPGVDICAAQWDNAWEYAKCLDDEHTAISGTSMATPHVAGVAALIKQAHPNWTPNQIKMALRKTAVDITPLDLGDDILQQGYGRINALGAVQLNRDPCVAKISSLGKTEGTFNIEGDVFCNNFDNYSLSYTKHSNKEPDSWTELITSSDRDNLFLYSGFDSENFDDGWYKLKLVVRNTQGDEYEDQILFLINNFEILKIGDTLNYIKGNEIIEGQIKIENYSEYKIEYQLDGEETWTEICHETQKLVGDILCVIDVSSIENGLYNFRLSILNAENTWLKDINFRAVVLYESLDSWPREINGFPRGNILVDDVDKDNSNELIVPHYLSCGMGWCGGSSLYIFESDGNFQFLDTLYENLTTHNVLEDWMPSIYSDKTLGQNFISLVDYYKAGLIDSLGNFINNWPILNNNQHFVLPSVIMDINGDGEDEILFTSFDYNDNYSIDVLAYDKQGNVFGNFPIDVQKENNLDDTLILREIALMNYNGEKRIGILVGDYRWDGARYLKLYFDTYDLNGNLINREYLFDDISKDVDFRLSYFSVGDLNRDGNEETVLSYSIIDMDLYFQDIHDINAYKTYVKIIGGDGQTISSPFTRKGYIVNKIALADLGERNPSIVLSLEETWPTYWPNGNKLLALDYLGNKKFEIFIDDVDHLIQGITTGDVDGDNESEIVVNYRPRWYDSSPSGIQIFDKNGVLEREIVIPTFGEVDDYSHFEPILSDFNNDGKIDIVQQTRSFISKQSKTRIFALGLDAQYNPDKLDWPMKLHDSQHTGVYSSIPIICGDLNLDNKTFEIQDLSYLTNIIIGTQEKPFNWRNGDMNGDGALTETDINIMSDHIFLFTPEPTCQPNNYCETTPKGECVNYNYCNGVSFVNNRCDVCGCSSGSTCPTTKGSEKICQASIQRDKGGVF